MNKTKYKISIASEDNKVKVETEIETSSEKVLRDMINTMRKSISSEKIEKTIGYTVQ